MFKGFFCCYSWTINSTVLLYISLALMQNCVCVLSVRQCSQRTWVRCSRGRSLYRLTAWLKKSTPPHSRVPPSTKTWAASMTAQATPPVLAHLDLPACFSLLWVQRSARVAGCRFRCQQRRGVWRTAMTTARCPTPWVSMLLMHTGAKQDPHAFRRSAYKLDMLAAKTHTLLNDYNSWNSS